MEDINNLKSKINREYFEYYAKYSLVMAVSPKYKCLRKGESPDWQSRRMNIGVEVTRAIDKDIYLAYNIINEYFGKVFLHNHIDQKIDEIKQTYAKLLKLDDKDKIKYDDILNIDNLQKRYIYKTDKLNKNYIKFEQNLLYMFTFKSMDESEVHQCFDVDLSKYSINYDICFINCFNKLYICDFTKKEILKSISVHERTLKVVKEKALRKSHVE